MDPRVNVATPVATRRRPMASRFFVWLLFPSVAAAEPLTEGRAVGLALGRPAVEASARAEVDLAESEATREGLWPNPVVSFTHEETGASKQDGLWIEQALDLSGRRSLRSDAALRRASAVGEESRAARLDLEAAVRARFVDVLSAEGRVAAIEARLGPMERIAETVARREAAGDVSGFDRRRLDREKVAARARLEVEVAVREAAWERLQAMLGGSVTRPAQGPLVAAEALPDSPPIEALLGRVRHRPELRALVREREAGELEARGGGRGWIPQLVLGGGYKRADGVDGFLVVASIALPVFDRRQDESERGAARSRRAASLESLMRAEADGEIRALHAEATRLAAASRRFREEAASLSVDLVRTAETAYAGGELGILELLDAHRGALDVEIEALAMETAARRARIALDRAVGGAR